MELTSPLYLLNANGWLLSKCKQESSMIVPDTEAV
jgi:hypothetical protein